jgi:hypothetical protein
MTDDRQTPFRDAHDDIESAREVPDSPQGQAAAYRLAFADPDFLMREELRPVRLQLELLKPELLMSEYGVESTIVLFGGARIPDPAQRTAPAPRRLPICRATTRRRAGSPGS